MCRCSTPGQSFHSYLSRSSACFETAFATLEGSGCFVLELLAPRQTKLVEQVPPQCIGADLKVLLCHSSASSGTERFVQRISLSTGEPTVSNWIRASPAGMIAGCVTLAGLRNVGDLQLCKMGNCRSHTQLTAIGILQRLCGLLARETADKVKYGMVQSAASNPSLVFRNAPADFRGT